MRTPGGTTYVVALVALTVLPALALAQRQADLLHGVSAGDSWGTTAGTEHVSRIAPAVAQVRPSPSSGPRQDIGGRRRWPRYVAIGAAVGGLASAVLAVRIGCSDYPSLAACHQGEGYGPIGLYIGTLFLGGAGAAAGGRFGGVVGALLGENERDHATRRSVP